MSDNLKKNPDEIELSSVILEIWKKKITVFIFIIIGILAGIIYLNNATFTYTVSLKIMPVKVTSSNMGIDSLGNQFGLLANITGFRVNNGSNDEFGLYKVIIFSRALAENLSKNNKFMKLF